MKREKRKSAADDLIMTILWLANIALALFIGAGFAVNTPAV